MVALASLVTVAVAALLLLNHLYFRSDHLLVLAFSLVRLLAALSIAACKAIHLCDIKPDKKLGTM